MSLAVSHRPVTGEGCGCEPSSAHGKFVVDKVTLGQELLGYFDFFPVNVILPVLRTHLHLRVDLTGGTNRRRLGNFPKNKALLEIEGIGYKILSFSFSL